MLVKSSSPYFKDWPILVERCIYLSTKMSQKINKHNYTRIYCNLPMKYNKNRISQK